MLTWKTVKNLFNCPFQNHFEDKVSCLLSELQIPVSWFYHDPISRHWYTPISMIWQCGVKGYIEPYELLKQAVQQTTQ